jgi:hypothetical protein
MKGDATLFARGDGWKPPGMLYSRFSKPRCRCMSMSQTPGVRAKRIGSSRVVAQPIRMIHVHVFSWGNVGGFSGAIA